MSSEDKEQKTEDASSRRLEELREQGKVAKSLDFSTAATLVAAAFALKFFGQGIATDVYDFTVRALRFQDLASPTQAVKALLTAFAVSTLPVMFVTALTAVVVGLAQTGGFFSLSQIAPKAERFDIMQNIQPMLPGKQMFTELGKSMLKIVLVGAAVYNVIADAIPTFTVLANAAPMVSAASAGMVALKLAYHGGLVFGAIALFDFYLAKRKFEEDSKMSKQELKDEHKSSEGDPHVKRKIKQKMMEMTKKRALADVKQATVLVTNPTHIAVALRYDLEKDAAPIVLAKGTDDVALEMRAAARRHGVPIVENRPLARALNKTVKPGQMVPMELYRAVAEVIAHVLALRQRVS